MEVFNEVATVVIISAIVAVVIIVFTLRHLRKKYPGRGHQTLAPNPTNTAGANAPTATPNPWHPRNWTWSWWYVPGFVVLLLLAPFIIGRTPGMGRWYRDFWAHETGLISPSPSEETETPLTRPRVRMPTKNEAWYRYFSNTPKPYGWELLDEEAEYDVPLDGQWRYYGINATFLEGSFINISCLGNLPNDYISMYIRGQSQRTGELLNESDRLPIISTGDTGGEAMIMGKKTGKSLINTRPLRFQLEPLPNHFRFPLKKVCETGKTYDIMQVQVGAKKDSPPWRLYVHFLDKDGTKTLLDNEVRMAGGRENTEGRLVLGSLNCGDKLCRVFDEPLLHARSAYSSKMVKETGESLMLVIKVPPVQGREHVTVEIILDVDYSAWQE